METKDKLAEIFDVEPVEAETKPIVEVKLQQVQSYGNDLETDYEYTRSNLYDLIDTGKHAISGILSVANESQHPRAYEVAATLIKNIGDVSDKLMNLHKMRKDIDGKVEQQNINVDKAIFVGSTSDLLQKIKNGDT
jgi:hypothetical protein